jgi:hypothetical protein
MDVKDKHEVDTQCFSTQGVTNSTTCSWRHQFTTLSIKIVICLLVDDDQQPPKESVTLALLE